MDIAEQLRVKAVRALSDWMQVITPTSSSAAEAQESSPDYDSPKIMLRWELEALEKRLEALEELVTTHIEQVHGRFSEGEAQAWKPPLWCQETDHNLLVDIRHLLHRLADRLEARPPSVTVKCPKCWEVFPVSLTIPVGQKPSGPPSPGSLSASQGETQEP